MSTVALTRRRSDIPEFLRTDVNIDALADEIFSRYAGKQDVVVDGTSYTTTYFLPDYCPDFRVMKLAGELALRVNQHAARDRRAENPLKPLRITVQEIMLAALLHDLGKQHEDCAPFLDLMKNRDLRRDERQLLDIVRDVHCRKGPCMIDRLKDAGHEELSNPFVATAARRHGEDYETNRSVTLGCWWAREINVITIADDYDAMVSEGPERAYKSENFSPADAVMLLRKGVERGRYEPRIAAIFISDVLGLI
jgi:response regulator RpfG family c-di-GMP phosphodiesterase